VIDFKMRYFNAMFGVHCLQRQIVISQYWRRWLSLSLEFGSAGGTDDCRDFDLLATDRTASCRIDCFNHDGLSLGDAAEVHWVAGNRCGKSSRQIIAGMKIRKAFASL
jgi:hypothetical protein